MSGSDKRNLEKILKLIKAGEAEDAYEQLKAVLVQNPKSVKAWEILLKIADSEKEREYAQFQINNLGGASQKPAADPVEAPSPTHPETTPLGSGWEGGEVRKAMELMKSGKIDQAFRTVGAVLQRKPDFPPALYVFGMLAETKADYKWALEKLAGLRETDSAAPKLYDKLKARKFREKRKRSKMPIWIIAGGASLLLILVAFALIVPILPPMNGGSGDDNIFETLPESVSCEELIASAMEVSDKGCGGIGTNQVCYGNYHLESEFDGPSEAFDLVGDILGIESLRTLKASPLDVIKKLWGVAVFRLAANMPGTVPGQNVTFLAFGNTEIDNDSGDMTAFYFSTGFGGIECNGIDFDGLKIDMPDGVGIEFVANDVEIVLEGDAIMVAQPGGEMDVTVVTGTGTVTSDGVTRTLVPGTSVSIPINENLEATGAPGEVEEVSDEQASLICQMYGVNCPLGETSFLLGEETPEATELAAVTPSETPEGFVASDTPTPTITDTPTITPEGFVASETPTLTKTKTPTNTPVTPTNTPVPPTYTPVPPTATSAPPTNTPVPVSCPEIGIATTGDGSFRITNNGGTTIVLESMKLWWEYDLNGTWKKVYLDGNIIGTITGGDLSPTTEVFEGHLTIRTFNSGASKEITTEFTLGANPGSYSVLFTFDNGCVRP